MAAISVTQHQQGVLTVGTTATITPAGATATGALLVVMVAVERAGVLNSVSDSGSNAWTIQVSEAVSIIACDVYICTTTAASPASITSLTLHYNGLFIASYMFLEVANCASNTTPIDVSHVNSASATSGSSGATGTPTNTGCLAVGMCGWNTAFGTSGVGAASFTAGTPDLDDGDRSVDTGSVGCDSQAAYKILTSAAAQTFTSGTFTNGSSAYNCAIALIKGTAAGGGASGPIYMPVPRRVRAVTRRRKVIRVEVLPAPVEIPVLATVQPRRVRGLSRRRVPRPTEVVPPQLNPPFVWQEIVQPRRVRGMFRRRVPMRTEVVPPQLNPPYPWSEIVQPRRLRGLGRRRVAARTEVVPEQPGPPIVQAVAVQPRRLRGLRRRVVARQTETVPQQFNPPYPWSEVVQPRRVRGLLNRRARRFEAPIDQTAPLVPTSQPQAHRRMLRRRVVPRQTETVQTQQQQLIQDLVPSVQRQARTVRGAYRRRKISPTETVPPQFNPPYPTAEVVQPRRPRGLPTRRARRFEAPVDQQPGVPVVSQPQTHRRGLRRRGVPRQTEVVTAQTQQTIQALPPTMQREARTVRGIYRRRKIAPTEVVPPQLNPPLPIVVAVQPRRLRGLGRRRVARPTEVVPEQPSPPTVEQTQPRRLRGLTRRRVPRPTEIVPAQVTFANPPFAPVESRQPRRLRGLFRRRVPRPTEVVPSQKAVEAFEPEVRIF